MGEAIEYCAVHDQPMTRCGSPGACRAVMARWGLYEGAPDTGVPDSRHLGVHSCDGRCLGTGPTEAELRAADELTALTEELGLYSEITPESPES